MTADYRDLGGCGVARAWIAPERLAPVVEVAYRALCQVGLCAGTDANGAWLAGAELTGRGWDDPRWLQVQQFVLGHAAVAELREDPALLALLAQVMGRPLVGAQGDIVRVACPGQAHLTTPPHQDGNYIAGADDLWTVWLPLVPCPLELGPLALIPGSHADGLRPHAPCHLGVPALTAIAPPCISASGEISPPWFATGLEPGDALLFHASVIHGALPNTAAQRLRVSIDLRFRPRMA